MNELLERLRRWQLVAVVERFRQSLFVIPVLCLVVGAVLAEIVIRLDRTGNAPWVPAAFETSTDNARSVLGAVAGGTITVVTLVLTLTLVAIQLSAGQLSPRTIANFLGDRFQQATVGLVLGTAAFSLLALRTLPETGPGLVDETQPDLTVVVTVVLTGASLIAVVRSVDRTANRLAVGTLLTDLAHETCLLVSRRYSESDVIAPERPGAVVGGDTEPDEEPTVCLDTPFTGWVQYIDEGELRDAVGEGATLELLHAVGTFVYEGTELLRVSGIEESAVDQDRLSNAVVIGASRTMQQDVAFGLVRLNDIGLRALSPGVNDPNTAREVILRIAEVILRLQEVELEPEVVEVEGRRIVRRGAATHDDYAYAGFDQLRRAAADDFATLQTLDETLTLVRKETERRGLPGSTTEVERQLEAVARDLERLDT